MLIKRQDAIEKLECFCMEKALEDQNHPSAEVGTEMSLANLDKVKQDFKQDLIKREDVSIWLNMWKGYLDEDMIGRMQIALKRDLPSAEPEIIRCRDCKHYAGEGMYCTYDIIVQFDHFYCYYAERREDEIN